MNMDEYELILTGFGLIVAITYYSFQIRNQNKTSTVVYANISRQKQT